MSRRPIRACCRAMSPGIIRFEECHIDLGRLARFAGARLIRDEAIGLDRARRACPVPRPSADPLGPVVDRHRLGAADATMSPAPSSTRSRSSRSPISPAAGRRCSRRAQKMPRLRLAVVGGGAGGVELALSAQHRLTVLCGGAIEVTLVDPGGAAAVAQPAGPPAVRADPGTSAGSTCLPAARSSGSSLAR